MPTSAAMWSRSATSSEWRFEAREVREASSSRVRWSVAPSSRTVASASQRAASAPRSSSSRDSRSCATSRCRPRNMSSPAGVRSSTVASCEANSAARSRRRSRSTSSPAICCFQSSISPPPARRRCSLSWARSERASATSWVRRRCWAVRESRSSWSRPVSSPSSRTRCWAAKTSMSARRSTSSPPRSRIADQSSWVVRRVRSRSRCSRAVTRASYTSERLWKFASAWSASSKVRGSSSM